MRHYPKNILILYFQIYLRATQVQTLNLQVYLGTVKDTALNVDVESGVPTLRLRRGHEALFYAMKLVREPSHLNGNAKICAPEETALFLWQSRVIPRRMLSIAI